MMVRKRATGYLMQDVGLLILLLCLGGTALSVGIADSSMRLEFVVMMMGTFLAILLAGFKLITLSVVIGAFEELVYTAYKLFYHFAYQEEIEAICYVWLILPLLSIGAMIAFIYGSRQTELENDVLKEQVEELVMVNSLTGLYNLRSLYNDLQKQVAYSERNQMTISLMIVKLRYGQELKKVLSRRNYEAMLQKMAMVVTDAVRLEDRTYSLDNEGTVGVILTCDQENSKYVKDRIKANLEKKDTFAGIMEKSVRVEVRIACLEYDREKYGLDMILFKQKVENELQYDV